MASTPEVPAPAPRVAHPDVSLWQSAVRQVVADRVAGGDPRRPEVRDHPQVRRSNERVDEYLRRGAAPGSEGSLGAILEVAQKAHVGLLTEAAAIFTHARAYSGEDPAFVIECITKFVEWYGLGRRPVYRDWVHEGGGRIDFGVVERPLPAGARIAVIGDWGTGMEDAQALAWRLLRDCRPDALVHVGDIYYSGTPREARYNFAQALTDAFAGRPAIPIFNLPGNHDYYSGGRGFYELLDGPLGAAAGQQASYFCARTADRRWQLVGVDTGQGDRVPGLDFDRHYSAPTLRDSEAEWARDKMEHFGGRTVMLSHHQLFSAHVALNGPESGRPRPNFNDRLLDLARPYAGRIAAWLWGHEHNLALYQDGLGGIARGRLLGCSGFEVGSGDDPYLARFGDVPFRSPEVRLSVHGGWYAHGFAMLDLGAPAIEYYAFPSWAPARPPAGEPLTPLFVESLAD